jgi:hypothetical protein
MWGALSDKRRDLSFTMLLVLASAVLFTAVKISSIYHLYLQFYMSPFYKVKIEFTKPFEDHDQSFFSTEPLRSQSSCNILSDEKMGLSLMKSFVSTGFGKQIMPILNILCYNGRLLTWTVVSLTKAKFKPLIFSMSGLALSYTANMLILMILYDLFLLHAQFRYIIAFIRKVESRVQIAERCAPRKISNGAGTLLCRRCSFKR